jgi:hypothetical protein
LKHVVAIAADYAAYGACDEFLVIPLAEPSQAESVLPAHPADKPK